MSQPYLRNSLFRPGPKSNLNACVGDNGGPYDFSAYAQGFFEGGFQIINSIKAGKWTIDLLIYPATFSFRHGIELYLKHMVQLLSNKVGGAQCKKTHTIKDDWIAFASLISKYDSKNFIQHELAIAQDIIDDFLEIDPTGQVFRYPEDLKGNPHLKNISIINVEVLDDGMKTLYDLLRDWSDSVEILCEPQASKSI